MIKLESTIQKLDQKRGGYCYFPINKQLIMQYEKNSKTRFVCTIDNSYVFSCGLNHLGDGNYFVMLTKDRIKKINKAVGDSIDVQLEEDTSKLGVEIPEVLEILLEQDPRLNAKFLQLTPGKQRSIIFQMNKIKDLNKQVAKTIELIDSIDLYRKNKHK
jgi:hypothetical protein